MEEDGWSFPAPVPNAMRRRDRNRVERSSREDRVEEAGRPLLGPVPDEIRQQDRHRVNGPGGRTMRKSGRAQTAVPGTGPSCH